MVRRLLVFGLVMALASVASAATWDWTGAASTVWDTPGNWTKTGTTWTYPSDQYKGTADDALINDDITAITIATGTLCEKVSATSGTPFLTFGGSTALYDDVCCTLTVSDGSTLYTGDDFVAGIAGTHTAINLLSGANISADYTYLGNGGICTVNISGGASFTPRNGSRLGWSGGTGYMTVDGGTYAPAYSLRLGGSSGAYGELMVKNSSVLDIGSDFRIGDSSGADGKVTINDGDVDVGTYMYVANGGTGTMDIEAGSTVDVTQDVRVGSSNTGTMTVKGGSTLSVGDTLYLGRNSSGDGTLNITGANSVVRHLGTGGGSGYNRMAIGYYGKGKVDIKLGGDLIVDGDLFVADQSSGDGTLLVSDPGSSVAVTGVNGDEFKIGRNSSSTGIVEVKAGATLTSAVGCTVASGGDTHGTLNVDGPNSIVMVSAGRLAVGYSSGSEGYVNITNGGKILAAGEVYVGDQAGSSGTLKVTGPNSLLDVTGGSQMRIGRTSTGVAEVTLGGEIKVYQDLVLGRDSTGHGTLTISGTDSKVSVVHNDMYLGRSGTGIINISDNGLLDCEGDALYLGLNSTGVATMTMTTGGTVHSNGRSYIGNSGTGTVDITGATYNADTDFRLAHDATGKGNLNLYSGAVLNIGRDFETCTGNGTVGAEGGEARIHMYAGEVKIDGYCALGDSLQGGSYTEFIMEDGTVDIGLDPPEYDPWDFDPEIPGNKLGDLILGWYDYDAEAYLTINSGEMTVRGAISFGSETHWTTEDPDNPGTYIPDPHTGSGTGTLRITINGGVLQGEDLVYTGNTPNSLLTLTAGYLKINGAEVTTADMLTLVLGPEIDCPNGYSIYTEDDYTVLTIPEPTTMTMVLLGLVSLALIRRKRRS